MNRLKNKAIRTTDSAKLAWHVYSAALRFSRRFGEGKRNDHAPTAYRRSPFARMVAARQKYARTLIKEKRERGRGFVSYRYFPDLLSSNKNLQEKKRQSMPWTMTRTGTFCGHQPLWDVRDPSGRIRVHGETYNVASNIVDAKAGRGNVVGECQEVADSLAY